MSRHGAGNKSYVSPRRQQSRLAALILMLCLVILLMSEARKPQNWRWLWHIGSGGAVGSDDSIADVNVNQNTSERQLFQTVRPEDLSRIRDNTGFRPVEDEIWYRWASELVRSGQGLIGSYSVGRVGYLQLLAQTSDYRGHVVSVHGIVRRANYITAPPNEHGIGEYWRCWLYTDNVSKSPIVVYSLSLPEGFPTGMALEEPARFDAIVFKRWVFTAQGGPTIAPLLIAKTAQWKPTATAESSKQKPTPANLMWLIPIAAACAVAAVVLISFLCRRDEIRRSRSTLANSFDAVDFPEQSGK